MGIFHSVIAYCSNAVLIVCRVSRYGVVIVVVVFDNFDIQVVQRYND